jgi:hypothetical protein
MLNTQTKADLSAKTVLVYFGLPDWDEALGQDDIAFPRSLVMSIILNHYRHSRRLTPISLRALPRTISDAPAE